MDDAWCPGAQLAEACWEPNPFGTKSFKALPSWSVESWLESLCASGTVVSPKWFHPFRLDHRFVPGPIRCWVQSRVLTGCRCGCGLDPTSLSSLEPWLGPKNWPKLLRRRPWLLGPSAPLKELNPTVSTSSQMRTRPDRANSGRSFVSVRDVRRVPGGVQS